MNQNHSKCPYCGELAMPHWERGMNARVCYTCRSMEERDTDE